ncbi:Lipoyl synthase [Bienertia sinuspersici]
MERFTRTKRLLQKRLVQLGDEGQQNKEPQDERPYDEVLQDEGPSNIVRRSVTRRYNKVKQFSKMSPTPLKKFISYGLTEEQKRDVMSIGFGNFCCWFIRHFNPFQSSVRLKHGHLQICIDDFHIVINLPMFGNSAQLVGSKETSLEYNELVRKWLEHLDKDRSNVTITDVVNKIKEQEGGGEDFKRNFVIMVVSTLIKGYKNGVPNYKLLKCLGDVNSINSLNCSQFALESLADCAREWKEADGTSHFTEPMIPLLLSYMYLVCFMGRLMDRRFPLIKGGEQVSSQQEILTDTSEHLKKVFTSLKAIFSLTKLQSSII